MPGTLQAITAAGVTFKRDDFADPHLDGPTALTVTADGRVFGHLAKWGTCHIGHTGQCVTPPSSDNAYQFFHQGVVKTDEGDLPVGKITLGTGHAALGEPAMAAAAHYDNTGAVVATVRAGEDAHGIYLAGRIVPGTSPERIDELRRSGVSGDWRGVNNSMELVAALAVNVPGFPIPRTEQLVAAGGVQSLVAAGVVAPASLPATQDEFDAMVASVVSRQVGEALGVRDRRTKAAATMAALTASAAVDRRARARAAIARVQDARDGNIGAITAAAAGKRVRSMEGARRFGVGIGDLIPDELLQQAANGAEGIGKAIGDAIGGKDRKKKDDKAAKVGESDKPAEGDAAAKDDAPKADDTKKDPAPKKDDLKEGDGPQVVEPKKDDAPADTAKAEDPAPAATKTDTKPKDAPKGNGLAKTPDGDVKTDAATVKATNPAPIETDVEPRLDVGAGTDHPMEEDESPMTGARGGNLVAYEGGVAIYDDGTQTDGKTWTEDPNAITPGDPAADPEGAAEQAATDGLTADYPPAESAYQDLAVGTDIDTTAPARTSGDGPLEEDELPDAGLEGGALVDYSQGNAIYSDGSCTDGNGWYSAQGATIESAATARAEGMQERAQDDPDYLETDVAPRASGYGAMMTEDEAPAAGASGGALVEYADGTASYDDGTSTDGAVWRQSVPEGAEDRAGETIAASAHRAALRRMGFRTSTIPAAWKETPRRPFSRR